MQIERRAGDRRVDPDVWSAAHLRKVKMIFGLAVGGFFFVTGTVVIVWIITNEAITDWGAGLGIGMWLMGGLAAFPSIAIPVISAIVRKVPGFGDVRIEVPEDMTFSVEEEDMKDES